MPSEKRQRQDEARLNKRVQQQTETKKQQRNNALRNFGIILVIVLVFIFGYSKLYGGSSKKSSVSTAATTTSTSAPATTTTAASTPTTAAGGIGVGTTDCPPPGGAAKRTITFSSGPKACIDVTQTYTAAFKTSRGDFTVSLDAKAAPKTVNSFVFLARNHYYDGVTFHRIIPGFVVQGGDANGNPPGTGGPGYTVPDELPTAGPPYYAIGSLAMANSGPNTNGSQFFVVTGDQGVQLPASYSLFGKVLTGMDVVKAIEATGTAAGTPSSTTTITSVTITES